MHSFDFLIHPLTHPSIHSCIPPLAPPPIPRDDLLQLDPTGKKKDHSKYNRRVERLQDKAQRNFAKFEAILEEATADVLAYREQHLPSLFQSLEDLERERLSLVRRRLNHCGKLQLEMLKQSLAPSMSALQSTSVFFFLSGKTKEKFIIQCDFSFVLSFLPSPCCFSSSSFCLLLLFLLFLSFPIPFPSMSRATLSYSPLNPSLLSFSFCFPLPLPTSTPSLSPPPSVWSSFPRTLTSSATSLSGSSVAGIHLSTDHPWNLSRARQMISRRIDGKRFAALGHLLPPLGPEEVEVEVVHHRASVHPFSRQSPPVVAVGATAAVGVIPSDPPSEAAAVAISQSRSPWIVRTPARTHPRAEEEELEEVRIHGKAMMLHHPSSRPVRSMDDVSDIVQGEVWIWTAAEGCSWDSIPPSLRALPGVVSCPSLQPLLLLLLLLLPLRRPRGPTGEGSRVWTAILPCIGKHGSSSSVGGWTVAEEEGD